MFTWLQFGGTDRERKLPVLNDPPEGVSGEVVSTNAREFLSAAAQRSAKTRPLHPPREIAATPTRLICLQDAAREAALRTSNLVEYQLVLIQ